MPFTFKLSQRLARMKLPLAIAAAAFAACELPVRVTDPTPPNSPVVQIVSSPDTVTLDPDQTQQFVAYGRTQAGDSVAVAVSWSASGGTITSGGLYTANSVAGSYQVTATAQVSGSSQVKNRGPMAQIILTPLSASAVGGGRVQFAVYGKRKNGDSVSVNVAYAATGGIISAVGLYTAGQSAGTYQVMATQSGGTLASTAAVTISSVPVASVAVSPVAAGLTVGATTQLTATPEDSTGTALTGRAVSWATSNAAVATVSASGLVTGGAAGSATITATSEGQSGTSALTVTNVPVASVTVSPAAATVTVGTTTQLTATPKDANGTALSGRVVTWGTSNAAAATVSANGVVTGVATGSATITATSEGQSGTSAITVTNVPVASVTVSPATASLTVGATTQLTATPKDANGTALSGRVVTWATSNAAAATVSQSGFVTGVAAGSATITATSEGQSGTAAIAVMAPPSNPGTVTDLAVAGVTDSSVTLSFTEVTDGTGLPASYDIRFAAGTISWGSATVVARGSCASPMAGNAIGAKRSCTVLGLAPSIGYQFQLVAFRGTLKLNAVFGALSNITQATTSPSTAAVATVAVSPAAASLLVGSTQQLSAMIKDANGNVLSGRTVTWASSALGVAAVSVSGLVTGLAIGSTTITATSEGITGSSAISVNTSAGTAHHYYGAPAGSDANPCTAAAPCYTMQRVSQLLTPGDTAHFAAGNYTWSYAGNRVTKSGTAAAPITYISDVKWGAKITGADCSSIWNGGDYVNIVNFDVTGNCSVGINQNGNYGKIIGNRVHDMPSTSNAGAILVDCCAYNKTGNQVIGNVVDNIGPWGADNNTHGIYLAGPGNTAMNNIVTRTAAACIQTYHGATHLVIANNVVANCGRYGIQISADPALTANDYTTVDNNIVVNVNGYGIWESSFGAIGTHNVYNNNIVYNNAPNMSLVSGTQSGTLALTSAQFSALFVNYTGAGMTGDYQLQGGAMAIDRGTTLCAASVVVCVPVLDFTGILRPQGVAYDIGAYEWH